VTETLLIDDMAGVRRAVAAMLIRAGHRVATAETGSQGVEMAAAELAMTAGSRHEARLAA
jgi:CheY-like chemotaxis protein